MLQTWAPVQDLITRREPASNSSQHESAEHREHRLRVEYEAALALFKQGDFETAKTSFLNLITQISERPGVVPLALPTSVDTATRPFARPAKRLRLQSQGVSEWECRLRYATYRNLAESCAALHEYKFALQAFSRALDDDSSDFLVWIHAARAAISCGQLHVARCAFESAYAKRPCHWLIMKPYRTLLSAIGDADDDVSPAPLSKEAEILAARRAKALMDERMSQPSPCEPEVLALSELSWANLVDVLRMCLSRRLDSRSELFVAHPVRLSAPPLSVTVKSHDNTTQSSDDIVVVAETRTRKRRHSTDTVDLVQDVLQDDSAEVQITATRSQPQQPHRSSGAQPTQAIVITGNSSHAQLETSGAIFLDAHPQLKERNVDSTSNERSSFASDARKPEVRRSSRRTSANLAKGLGRRTTRTDAENSRNQKEDEELVKALVAICLRNASTNATNMEEAPPEILTPEKKASTVSIKDLPEDIEQLRVSPWKVVLSENEEAAVVHRVIQSFRDNGGPADLMLRILSELSKIKAVQYFSTLAMLWLSLRERVQLSVPDSPETSVLIVEALLVSGKKAGKQKARRFQEAGRVLSQIRLTEPYNPDHALLSMRIAWLWGILHDCKGEMQLSFEAAEHTLVIFREIKADPGDAVPSLAGPELSGYSWGMLEKVILLRISKLRGARDLEKAESELFKVSKGDVEAARRTAHILAPSVYSTIEELELNKWRPIDSKVEFSDPTELEELETQIDKEVELEPRLKVLFEACCKAEDEVGELMCFSIQLRMALHYYAAKVRTESESSSQEKDTDTSAARLADLLVCIRRFAMLIKKLSSVSNSTLVAYDKKSSCGWSMEQAANVAANTITSLTELIVAKIPLSQNTGASVDLSATDKNRRLGFMRCMLAFPRCIALRHRSRVMLSPNVNSREENESNLNRTMLYTARLCLHALVIRGCCREEGTSGALIRLYTKVLSQRLQRVAGDSFKEDVAQRNKSEDNSSDQVMKAETAANEDRDGEDLHHSDSEMSDIDAPDKRDPEYHWRDARVLRHELAQCFECLYQIPELETMSSDESALDDIQWLEEGCRVSKHIGLSFVGNELPGSMAVLDVEACRNIYFFYRKRIFEAICLRRRDGRRVKRVRDVLARLAEALPENAPNGVPMLSFQCLDSIVCEIVEQSKNTGEEAANYVSRLEKEWKAAVDSHKSELPSTQLAHNTQLAIMYFEVCSLNAMAILDSFDTEYKKQKNAERRKRPREMADRLLMASSECLIALRSRPWSVGAWILLGRLFVEISDLALDERELCVSSFGLYHFSDISSLGDGDSMETNLSRAEACFGFAESLLCNTWAISESKEEVQVDFWKVLGLAFDGNDDEPWYGFGDDGDLYSPFGLSNATTSRIVLRGEPHPILSEKGGSNARRFAAIRLGSCALNALRLRERRYFYLHWTQCSLDLKSLMHPANQYPTDVVVLASRVLEQLREGLQLLECSDGEVVNDEREDKEGKLRTTSLPLGVGELEWRTGYCWLSRVRWYYTLLEAKMLRKCGYPPYVYLPVFHKAVEQNRTLRDSQKQPRDIEPFYKLHSARMKILRSVEEKPDAAGLLTLLERFSYQNQPPIVVDDVADDEDWMTARRNAIAEDLLLAMQACNDNRGSTQSVPHSEYFFKSTFVKAVLLADVLKDTSGAISELKKLFRIDAAVRVMDQGPDGIYRGYFYKLWNYRFTDTGTEPALETERKLIRWRSKLLGLFGQLLQQNGDWRTIAGIVLRLKKRSSEDLPVDGAILDDLIEAYATIRRESIISSMQRGILTDAVAFEASFRLTWDIFTETLRLSHGIRRVSAAFRHGVRGGTGELGLLSSRRPRCLTPMNSVLRVELVRWRGAVDGTTVDVESLKSLPDKGQIDHIDPAHMALFAETLEASMTKWPIDDKLSKLLKRQIDELKYPTRGREEAVRENLSPRSADDAVRNNY